MTLSQKLLLGFGALVAYLYLTSGTSQAATGPSGASGGAGGSGPQAGDSILVNTSSTGAAGQIFIRSAPLTLAQATAATNAGQTSVGTSNIVAIAQHGDTLTATGSTQVAGDGTTWWQVTNGSGTSGWADSTYLLDQSQQTS
jgi:hypothetical protein